MKHRIVVLVFISVLNCMPLHSQDIESKLSGNSSSQGFTIKNNRGATLFTVRANGNVGIGIPIPEAVLTVNGQIQMGGGSPGAGKVLTSDARGLARWETPASGGSLDQAYDFGSSGAGRTIIADAGAVTVAGVDGLLVTGTYGNGVIPAVGAGVRMMFYPKKAAFRVGSTDSVQWADGNISFCSIAMGYRTRASNLCSVAMGRETIASGNSSTALGTETIASGELSTAMGYGSWASAAAATAMGERNIASAACATAMGCYSRAEGVCATAIGERTTARGLKSVSMGCYTYAGGDNSIATGYGTMASGHFSMAANEQTTASGRTSTAMGNLTTASGDYSTAIGEHTTASGRTSTAMGALTIASGDYSVAIGEHTTASGQYSTATGFYTTASGDGAFVSGIHTIASGRASTAMGAYVNTNDQTGAFLIGDNSANNTLTATTANCFKTRFAGGYYLYSNSAASLGVSVAPNGTSWSTLSDSTKKCHVQLAEPERILSRFSSLRLGSWNYIADQDRNNRHFGPMAQEWFAAFGNDGIGTIGNDTTLASADVDGVLCIAVKALERRTAGLKEQTVKIAVLEAAVKDLGDRLVAERDRTMALEESLSVLRAELKAIRAELAGKTTPADAAHASLDVAR